MLNENNLFLLKMLFSIVGEIGLIIVAGLYVLDCWFDSCINLIETTKEEKEPEMSEAAKRMYS